MFRGRRQLQRRDLESGLAFNWRLPLSSAGSWLLAILLIGLVAVALATMVRVHAGAKARPEPEPGTLVLVPAGLGGDRLDRRAVEAGPFPLRWNPAADPAYVALRREALRTATESGVPYDPKVLPLGGEEDDEASAAAGFTGGVLPALPAGGVPEVPAGPREVLIGPRVLDAGGAVTFEQEPLALSTAVAGEVLRARYLVEYDGDGRVVEVVALAPRKHRKVVAEWLARGRVTGGPDEGGWLSVETVVVP